MDNNLLRTARLTERIPVQEIVDRLGYKSRQTYYNFESKETIPDLKTIEKLAEILNVPVIEVLEYYGLELNEKNMVIADV